MSLSLSRDISKYTGRISAAVPDAGAVVVEHRKGIRVEQHRKLEKAPGLGGVGAVTVLNPVVVYVRTGKIGPAGRNIGKLRPKIGPDTLVPVDVVAVRIAD